MLQMGLSPWIRRLALLLVAGFLLCGAAGCVKISTTITADGRIRREVRCQVAKEHRDSARIELQRVFARGAGWYIREVDMGSKVSFLATCRATKPDKDPFDRPVTVTRTERGLRTEYRYEEDLTDATLLADDERPYAKDVELVYTVTMPGRIDEATASRGGKQPLPSPETGGHSVSWALTMGSLAGEGIHLGVSATRTNWRYAGALGFGVVVLLLLVYMGSVRLSVWRRLRAFSLARRRAEDGAAVEILDVADDEPGSSEPPTSWPPGTSA